MKNILKYLLILAFGAMLFASCEEEEIILEEKIVGFTQLSGNINEPSATPIKIAVYNAAKSGKGCSVSFTFSVEGIANPAIEGTDFTVVNSTSTLSFANYYATDTIIIQPVNNNVFGGNKKVNIVLGTPTAGFELTNQSTYALTIIDDEHPLATWIGSYTVDAASNLSPGAWDEVWNVTTVPNPANTNQLFITGISGSSQAVTATLDVVNMTITIPIGSALGDPYGWTNVAIYGFDGASIITGGNLTGTISNDGTIYFPYMVISAVSNPGNVWDIFTPTFTKN